MEAKVKFTMKRTARMVKVNLATRVLAIRLIETNEVTTRDDKDEREKGWQQSQYLTIIVAPATSYTEKIIRILSGLTWCLHMMC